MTRQTKAIRLSVPGVGVLAVLVLAGCGKPAGRHARIGPVAVSSSAASAPAGLAHVQAASPVGEAAARDAVGVARAFTDAICPYSWRDPVPYGQRLNAALARWGTAEFAAARRWSPARIATAAAGLAEHQAAQTCAGVTGGLDPEADPNTAGAAVRLSVTVTAAAASSAASTAQEVFDYQLVRQAGGGWLISSGRW